MTYTWFSNGYWNDTWGYSLTSISTPKPVQVLLPAPPPILGLTQTLILILTTLNVNHQSDIQYQL